MKNVPFETRIEHLLQTQAAIREIDGFSTQPSEHEEDLLSNEILIRFMEDIRFRVEPTMDRTHLYVTSLPIFLATSDYGTHNKTLTANTQKLTTLETFKEQVIDLLLNNKEVYLYSFLNTPILYNSLTFEPTRGIMVRWAHMDRSEWDEMVLNQTNTVSPFDMNEPLPMLVNNGDFTPNQTLMTRYANRVVNNRFYGHVRVSSDFTPIKDITKFDFIDQDKNIEKPPTNWWDTKW